jgi:hypothetical protein
MKQGKRVSRGAAPAALGLMLGAPILLALLLSSPALAQTAQKPDAWEPMKYFIGSWEGTSKGQPGNGTVEREYLFILNGKILQAKSKSTYAPQEKNPKGEVHEDLGLYSYDRARKKFVLRQFHVEGFVNQYISDSKSEDGKTLVFITESIENIPTGFKARETYRIVNDNEFMEVFELAEPGKAFEVYSETSFKRKGRP